MPMITNQPKTMQKGDNITVYSDTVGTTQTTYTFPTNQERTIIKNKGTAPIQYTIGSKSGTLGPAEQAETTEIISSFTLQSTSKTQAFEVWSDEEGTKGTDASAVASISQKVDSLSSQLAQNVQQKGTTQSLVFNTDGTIQKVIYKDAQNNIVGDDTFTYSTNLITEVKTRGSNATTYKYHLDTLQTEVI